MASSNNYRKKFDKTIYLSNNITGLHMKLSRIEYEKGKDSLEYQKLVSAIKVAKELEKKFLEDIAKYQPILLLFKEYALSKNCKRITEKLKNDSDLVKKVFLARLHERYDELKKENKIDLQKKEFLQKEYAEHGIKLLSTIIFNLISSKTYVELIDDYIEETDDEDIKKSLIYEKNLTLSRDGALEDWYFGFNDNLDALLVESDTLMSSAIDKPLENYQNLKNNYYINTCDNMIRLILEESYKTDDIKLLYELNILSLLLNMDAKGVSDSFTAFQNEIDVNPYDYDGSSIDFIHEIYGKSVSLAKKYNNRKK